MPLLLRIGGDAAQNQTRRIPFQRLRRRVAEREQIFSRKLCALWKRYCFVWFEI